MASCQSQPPTSKADSWGSGSHDRGSAAWASYQIRKIAGCACAGNAGNVFPRRRFQRKPLVRDPDMHHGTCVTHVPWCMSGSLTCGNGENVPGIPGACAPGILRIWQEAHGIQCNLGVRMCGLCDDRCRDNPEHILFECQFLESFRDRAWSQVLSGTPRGMVNSTACYNNKEKMRFLLSELKCESGMEWHNIFEEVVIFVYAMYSHRKENIC